MGDVIASISQNPNIAGYALFIIVFLPILRYVIRWAEKTTKENKKTYEYVLAQSERREERLECFINSTLLDTTKSLNKVNNNIDRLNTNVNNLSEKVCSIERRLGG